MKTVIGRKFEKQRLDLLYNSGKSEFVAVYGRRRIGKTYLLREYFSDRMAFHHTGLAESGQQEQLINFQYSLKRFFENLVPDDVPQTWLEALHRLQSALEKLPKGKKVVFIDELPWMDTPRSGFLPAFEHFWNAWASARTDILLVGCGSVASWMMGKIVRSKGGFHNRITERIHLKAFSLSECEELCGSLGLVFNRHQMMELYMILGGTPYYWSLLAKGKSAAQCVDDLFFNANALLKDEFKNLYASLFRFADNHQLVVEALSKKAVGLTRDELVKATNIPNGGGLTKVLEELESGDFIRRYSPFGRKQRESLYQLMDFFTLFYFRFAKNRKVGTEQYWLNQIDLPNHRIWSGYAFELLCLQHVEQIKHALGVSGVHTEVASWRSKGDQAAQIDLVLDRRDSVVNICEMKFAQAPFVIDKKYDLELRTKMDHFRTATKTRKAVHLTFVSPFGLKDNAYSGLAQQSLNAESLFT
jgi:AAA+ ATPase superfamily predicted ATPase